MAEPAARSGLPGGLFRRAAGQDRHDGLVRNTAAPVALAVRADGSLWLEQSAGAKFWLKLRNELKTRGATAILIAVVDGLKGCPEASGAVFPSITVQACILPLIGNPLASVSGTDRKLLMPDLTAIDRAETTGTALAQPDAFGTGHPLSRGRARPWRRAREHVVPRFAFPPAIRTMIYTTNAVESLNRSRRNIIKTREDARQLPE